MEMGGSIKATEKTNIQKNEDESMIDTLPLEVITNDIMVRVAASSSDDMFNLKQSCKTLCEVSNDKGILQSVSLEKFHPIPWKLKEKTFLESCTNSDNPEALYRTGMIQYFGKKELAVSGMECLEKAMNAGHLEAKYATGIVLILQGDERKQKGMQIIVDMKKSNSTAKDFKEIRENFLGKLTMWVNNTMIVGQKMPVCCTKHTAKSEGWVRFEDIDHLECEDCSCDQELVHLWKVLPNSI